MQRAAICILVLVFTGLFSAQAVGLHLHANVDGGGLHGWHLHHADPDGHDHSGDIDVSLLELSTTWLKIFTFLIPFVVPLLAPVWRARGVSSPPLPVLSTRRRSRWRPPLRAPPLTA